MEEDTLAINLQACLFYIVPYRTTSSHSWWLLAQCKVLIFNAEMRTFYRLERSDVLFDQDINDSEVNKAKENVI